MKPISDRWRLLRRSGTKVYYTEDVEIAKKLGRLPDTREMGVYFQYGQRIAWQFITSNPKSTDLADKIIDNICDSASSCDY